MTTLRSILKKLLLYPAARQVKRRTLEQQFTWVNERHLEYAFLFDVLSRLKAKTVLDVGTGTSSLPALLRTCGYLVQAMDNVTDYWPMGMTNLHHYVQDDDIRHPRLKEQFDAISCISVLEHIIEDEDAMRGMFGLLRDGGSLVLTVPYNELSGLPNAYDLPTSSYGRENPYICRVYCRADVEKWMAKANVVITEQVYWQVFSGAYWTEGEQLYPRRKGTVKDPHQLTGIVFQKRS